MKLRRPQRPSSALLLGLAVAVTVAGCHKGYSRQRSPVARAPVSTTGDWERAVVAVAYYPATTSGPQGARPARVQQVLELGRGTFGTNMNIDEAQDVGGVEGRRFRAMADERFTVRFGNSGRALELSVDGGRNWRFLGLDAGGMPFVPLYCVHNSLATAAPFPQTRDLVLELLASPLPGAPANRRHGIDDHDGTWEREVRVAVGFACRQSGDAALCEALARASGSPRFQFTGAPPAELEGCLAACRNPAPPAPAELAPHGPS